MEEPEKVNSINLSNNPKEVDWDLAIIDLLQKANGANVMAPYVYYEALSDRVKWIPATIIHEN